MSNSWSFCTPVTGASARPAPHCPQAAGAHTTVSSGLATWRSVDDCPPGCFPAPPAPLPQRPVPGLLLIRVVRRRRLDDVEESLPRRRSSSTTDAEVLAAASGGSTPSANTALPATAPSPDPPSTSRSRCSSRARYSRVPSGVMTRQAPGPPAAAGDTPATSRVNTAVTSDPPGPHSTLIWSVTCRTSHRP
jgi:hypothetical protein